MVTINCVAMVKAQLSIDYVIVFSFVLIIFVLIFGLVATQLKKDLVIFTACILLQILI